MIPARFAVEYPERCLALLEGEPIDPKDQDAIFLGLQLSRQNLKSCGTASLRR
jgi:hypothetical protein